MGGVGDAQPPHIIAEQRNKLCMYLTHLLSTFVIQSYEAVRNSTLEEVPACDMNT